MKICFVHNAYGKVSGEEIVVNGIASNVESLGRNEPYRQSPAKNALQKARDFSWERKAELVTEIYAKVIRKFSP